MKILANMVEVHTVQCATAKTSDVKTLSTSEYRYRNYGIQ
jgi:hypothetical protein